MRIGDRSELASSEVLNELILKGSNRTLDALNSGISYSDASFTVLHSRFKQRTDSSFIDSDYESFHLKSSADETLTNAGTLLADEALVRHSRLFCTRWNGLHKDDAIDDAEFSGSLLILLREGEAFAKRHNQVAWEKVPNDRIDRPSYAERAITEALVNALIHCDYLRVGSEVNIDIYDNRMVISSPGDMFENGILPSNPAAEEVRSKRRNPILADLFQRMGYMERRGSDLRKICHETSVQDNFKAEFMPVFKSANGDFAVTLWNMNYLAESNTQQVTQQVEVLLEALGGQELSTRELMEVLGLADRNNFNSNYLYPALDSGLVQRTIPEKQNSKLQKYRRIS